MSYAEKRDGKLTGYWYGEVITKDAKRFRRRFETKKDANGYELYVKLTGEEPPTIEGASSGRTFAVVAAECKAAGGPRGVWKHGRDPSLLQRLEYVTALIGHYDIVKVDRVVLQLIVTDLEKRPAIGKKKKLARGTINRYLTTATAVLSYAKLCKYIVGKPAAPLQKENGRLRPLVGYDQETAILGAMRTAGDVIEALCVLVLVETGLREGELLGNPQTGEKPLRPGQITFEPAEDQTENAYIGLESDETKNNAARSVYIRPDLARELLVVMRAGRLPKAFRLLKRFKRAAKACGYPPNMVIHSLRHTRNTRLRKEGVDMKIRMTMIGHKSVAASMRYDHIDAGDQLEAAKKVQKRRGETPQDAVVLPFSTVRSA